ncbi:methyl-accepting chemotaxis protein [Ponticaulis profundi]|uniref:PAS domain S-box protein n=1 Tax=Ponticaulis profundi TaxID=2665222 RepID=A0ABW1SCB0_9PROT
MFGKSKNNNTVTDAGRMEALDRSQAIIEFHPDGTIRNANQNFLDTVGYSLEEIRGKHHSIFVAPNERNSDAYKAFWAELRAGQFKSAEFRRFGKDGREVWIQASYNPIKNEAGDVIAVMKIASDTTQAKLASAENAGQIDALYRSQAVIHFTPNGRILDANENFLETTGYSLDEIQGRHHSMFVAKEEKGPEYDAFWKALQNGEYQAAQYRRIGKNGREFYINATYNPIFDMDGKVFKVVKFATDETGRMKRNETMKAIDADIARIQTAITKVVAEAEKSAEASKNTNSSVEQVATGSVQLAASVAEISEQISKAGTISSDAVTRAHVASTNIESLSQAAEQITNIVNLISSIAEQTNLLALNATIEAARAGEAGKGFAVVASEVKQLATQSARATEEITSQIQAILSAVTDSKTAISEIEYVVNEVNKISTSVAGAVEEQSAVTQDISRSMRNASQMVAEVSSGFDRIAKSTDDVRQSTEKMKILSSSIAS